MLLDGRDLLGIAQTGTGKTAAFALPILQQLSQKPERAAQGTCRALILSPTRELASQIADSFKTYGRHLNALAAPSSSAASSLGQQVEVAARRRRHPGRDPGPPARPDRRSAP